MLKKNLNNCLIIGICTIFISCHLKNTDSNKISLHTLASKESGLNLPSSIKLIKYVQYFEIGKAEHHLIIYSLADPEIYSLEKECIKLKYLKYYTDSMLYPKRDYEKCINVINLKNSWSGYYKFNNLNTDNKMNAVIVFDKTNRMLYLYYSKYKV